jgi:hypothetical protein
LLRAFEIKETLVLPGLQCVKSGGHAYQDRSRTCETQGFLRRSAGYSLSPPQ